MKNYKISILISILILLSILSILSNYKIYKSHILQVDILREFNSQKYTNLTYRKLMNHDLSYPNIGVTGIPTYMSLAKYHIMFNENYKAIFLLNSKDGKASNPYLKFEESLKAEVYLKLDVRDSSYYYSRLAYENLPGNPLFFQQYIRELVNRKEIDTIKKILRENKYKEKDHQFYKNYFASVLGLMDKDDEEIRNFARLAIKEYPRNSEIELLSSYILYGKENVDKSYQLSDQGQMEFEKKNYSQSAEYYINAYNLYQQDYTFSENAGMALLNDKQYKKAIDYFELAIEFEVNTTGKSQYGLAICYNELDEIERACKFFDISMSKNYIPAFKSYTELCGS